jgi:hypothetical protein
MSGRTSPSLQISGAYCTHYTVLLLYSYCTPTVLSYCTPYCSLTCLGRAAVRAHHYYTVLHCTATLHCYTALLHCTATLYCYTALLHCTATLYSPVMSGRTSPSLQISVAYCTHYTVLHTVLYTVLSYCTLILYSILLHCTRL